MATPTESHYDALGVPRGARQGDIKRAFDRLIAELGLDSTPPDQRREARIREAYEALSDEEQRKAYDRSLDVAPATFDRRRAGAIVGIAVAVMAAGAWFFFGQGEPPAEAGRTAMEIQAEVVSSVGRVQSIEMSGKATTTGIAFTVAKGIMATTCEGLAPGSQVVVTIGTRAVPAHIAMTDEARGLCKLAVEGAGSWPLPMSWVEPRVGDKVYAAGVNAAGEVVLAEGSVKRIVADAPSKIVEASVPVAAGIGGRPLLDIYGRVMGVATASQPGGAARHVSVPLDWAAESPVPQAAPAPAPEPSAPSDAPGAQPSPSMPEHPGSASHDPVQGRAESMARKLRPPPTVPDDL